MKLQLIRTQFGDDATNGLLFVDGVFECYTLEDQYQDQKVYGETCIPEGTYPIEYRNEGGFFLICNLSKHQDSGQSIGNKNTVIRYNVSFNDNLRCFIVNGPVESVQIHGNVIYNTIEDELQLIIDTPWEDGRFAQSVEVTDNLFYTAGLGRIYEGTWDGSGMGLWKEKNVINRKRFNFRGNAYSRVAGFDGQAHEEPEILELNKVETLGSLIGRFDNVPEVRDNFDKMHRFLEESRYWEDLKSAL